MEFSFFFLTLINTREFSGSGHFVWVNLQMFFTILYNFKLHNLISSDFALQNLKKKFSSITLILVLF